MDADVAVLGAGMVGVACALELRRRGARVTLIDRRDPGQETSYGNAGVIARSSLMPLNNPALWAALPGLIRNRSAALRYDARFILSNLRWLTAFLGHARARSFAETTRALDALIGLSMTEHRRLIARAGAGARLAERGWVYLYRSETGFAAGALARDVFAEHGVATEILDQGGLADLEPGLNPIFPRALWIKDAASVDGPGELVEDYARLFASQGGRIVRNGVAGLETDGGTWRVRLADGQTVGADRVVVALGPWSQEFLDRMGLRVRMGYERGYHMHFAPRGNATLGRPVYDTAGGYVLAPMSRGLRMTTGVELNRPGAPPDPRPVRLAEARLREAFPIDGALDDTPWMGSRPTLPDARPVIGAAPGRAGLWLAFGHQHIGFSTGPGTARLLAEMMAGETPSIDPEPFRPERFVH